MQAGRRGAQPASTLLFGVVASGDLRKKERYVKKTVDLSESTIDRKLAFLIKSM